MKKRGTEAMLILLELAAGEGNQVPEWMQIVPAGWVKSLKGDFLVDATARREILRNWQGRGLDVVFDYEHQTLTGNEAPASGWIKELADRGDDGIWGRVEWTDHARQLLANREYRYHSPVVLVRKDDGRAVYLHSAALTNTPAINGLEPLVASLRQITLKGDPNMDWLEYLKSVLQLPADAEWNQVIQTVQNLSTQTNTAVSANKAVLQLLDLPDTATPDQVSGKIMSLKNPGGMVPITEHLKVQGERDAAVKSLAERDAGDLVEKALSVGKIAPAQKEWATTYALKDPGGFKSFIELSPPVVPVGEDISGTTPANKTPGGKLDETQVSVNNMLGITAEEFTKHGGAN